MSLKYREWFDIRTVGSWLPPSHPTYEKYMKNITQHYPTMTDCPIQHPAKPVQSPNQPPPPPSGAPPPGPPPTNARQGKGGPPPTTISPLPPPDLGTFRFAPPDLG
eukprot:gene7509-3628_t